MAMQDNNAQAAPQATQFNEAEQRLLDQMQLYSAEIIHGKASDSILNRLNAQDPVEGLVCSTHGLGWGAVVRSFIHSLEKRFAARSQRV